MLKFDKPEVGQEVTVVECGNLTRNRKGRIFDGKVVKVGRKYFTIKVHYGEGEYQYWEKQFSIENWRQKTEYSADYEAYPNKQVYFDRIELYQWKTVFRRAFETWSNKDFALEQFREAAKIFDLELSEDS